MKDRMILALLWNRRFNDSELETLIHSIYLERTRNLLSDMVSTGKMVMAKDGTGYFANKDSAGVFTVGKKEYPKSDFLVDENY